MTDRAHLTSRPRRIKIIACGPSRLATSKRMAAAMILERRAATEGIRSRDAGSPAKSVRLGPQVQFRASIQHAAAVRPGQASADLR